MPTSSNRSSVCHYEFDESHPPAVHVGTTELLSIVVLEAVQLIVVKGTCLNCRRGEKGWGLADQADLSIRRRQLALQQQRQSVNDCICSSALNAGLSSSAA